MSLQHKATRTANFRSRIEPDIKLMPVGNVLKSMMGFGLQHSTSWTRDNATNNFLYDGGSELNTTTALYDLPYRNYDPTLGRFFQVDPLAHVDHNLTPYHYSRNNPMGYSDPSGALEDSEFIEGGNNEWSVDQTTSSEGGGGDGGGDGQVTVHGIVDNGNGTYTVTVTGADGQGYTAVVNESGDVLNAVNNDAFDAGNTSNVSVSGTYFTNNGDGTGTGVSWSTGGGQFTMTATTGALDSNGGILAGSGSTFNSTSIDTPSQGTSLNYEGGGDVAYAGIMGNNYSFVDLINFGLGGAGAVLNTTQANLQAQKAALQAGKYSRGAARSIASIDKSLARVSRLGRNLGYAGIALNAAVVLNSYVNGDGVTKSQVFDLAVGVGLGVLTVSNPVFLVGFGVYGLLDSAGVFDDVKTSLGGNDIILSRH